MSRSTVPLDRRGLLKAILGMGRSPPIGAGSEFRLRLKAQPSDRRSMR